MASSTLDPLWQEWLTLHERLSAVRSERLAGLFPGYKPDGYEEHKTEILYVGKATAGPFVDESSSSPGRDLEQQRAFAKVCFYLTQGGFWNFAERLCTALGCDNRSNLVWSNLCKIGTDLGNPSDELVGLQQELGITTLRAEIDEYNPSIVVFVSGQFAQKILLGAIDDPTDGSWNKSEEEGPEQVKDVWWRKATATTPAVLWMRHPQFAPKSLTSYAQSKICELVTTGTK
jgi:hypothetical protein